MTREEYERTVGLFHEQVAERIGRGVAHGLETIADRDSRAAELLLSFCEAFSEWFEAAESLREQQAAESPEAKLGAARERLIQRIRVRAQRRGLLVDYLDSRYPFSARGRPGDDVRVLSGIGF